MHLLSEYGNNNKRIVLFGGANSVLQYIMEQYQKAFLSMGHNVFIFPYVTTAENAAKYEADLFTFHEQGLDVGITFNNYGFTYEITKGVSLWDYWKVPCCNIVVDHPMHYFDSLDDTPSQGIIVCSDRNHKSYAERFYPSANKSLFIPTGGEELHPNLLKKPIQDRSIDVLFLGNYKYTELNFYDDFEHFITNYLIQHLDMTFAQAVETCLLEAGFQFPDSELKMIIQSYSFVEVNVASLYRLKIIQQLLSAGVTVRAYGIGWEETDIYHHPGFTCIPSIPFRDGLALMEDSKIVLNQLFWFKDGACERIFNAMLQGAVCLTDDTPYLREILTDNESVVFYSLSELDKLSAIVTDLLKNPDKMQAIADCGYQTALAGHTWKHRAYQLLDTLFPESNT